MEVPQRDQQEILNALTLLSTAFPEARPILAELARRANGGHTWSGQKLLARSVVKQRKACAHFSAEAELHEETPCDRCKEPFVSWSQ